MLAGKPRWKMCFTVRVAAAKEATSTLACGLDIGWRKRPEGDIRVAYLVDENDHREELLLPGGDMDQFHKLDDLKSIMDHNFNEIRDKLTAGLKIAIEQKAVVPQALMEVFEYISHWKSPGRLVHAMKIWTANRLRTEAGSNGRCE